MSLTEWKNRMVTEVKVRRLALMSIMLTGLVGMVSATLNDSVAPVIIGLTLLFTPLLAVIVAAVPLIVTIPREDPFLLGV
jgi:uncharacterized membrane protein YgaE (UPF0421/DUF939 family)